MRQDIDSRALREQLRAALNAELDLRAEIERLQASLKMTNGGERQLSAYLKLEADNERLRAAGCAPGQCKYGREILIAKDAEIARLQGVIQQLNEGNDVLATRCCDSKTEIERLRQRPQPELDMTLLRIEHLEADNERLRAAVREASRGGVESQDLMQAEIERLRGIVGDFLWDIGHDNNLAAVIARAKAALEHKL